MENKTDLRIWAKSIRKELDLSQKSGVIVEKIKNLDAYKCANNIMLYYPKRYEIDLTLLLDESKNFYLPRVCGENMEVCPYKKGDALNISDFKVCEPCTCPVNPEILDLVIVPALLVDKFNYRLGYGGGFYDRFLANIQAKTVILIAKELVVEKLPIEEFDISVDYVLTD